MFSNPVLRAILLSSGAIPVQRNPNNGNGAGDGDSRNSGKQKEERRSPQVELFRESSNALAAGQVLGVFPEGTSYTQPGIVQVLPGAVWAAVEYMRSVRDQSQVEAQADDIGKGKGKGKKKGSWTEDDLTIVPVGIVYTDKARYQSRVCVRYGTPIAVSAYTAEIFANEADADAAARNAVKQITAEIEKQLRALSVNAPDWDTLYAAEMARDILWQDPANVPLKDWVAVSQTLVGLFTVDADRADPLLLKARTALNKYHSLLHHTSIAHSELTTLIPLAGRAITPWRVLGAILKFPLALTSLLLFTPSLLLYIPAYATGALAVRMFVRRGEKEAEAQFKAVFGGLGLGLSLGVMGALLKSAGLAAAWLPISGVQRIASVLGATYGGVWLLVRWHNTLVYRNYKRLKTLLTLHKLCLGLLPQRPAASEDVAAYTRPPPPPSNRFIKKMLAKDPEVSPPPPGKKVPRRKLVLPLLSARAEAVDALRVYILSRGNEGGDVGRALEFLKASSLGVE
ncbi:hypothetical protein H0H81_001755 [Sphagnurus paluster]|uniref:Phospholipid/glycerol acyltransferase domain-containing protein n=1 Tax=Sphagnurus paluster TaxID=117069 RepID=A0A9P7KKI9_9AGAR|nr:hypothetical protein H0H81_001755 [Sphagnurus paluster]